MCGDNSQRFSRTDFLSACSPFSSLPSIVVELLASRMREQSFEAGDCLMRQGDPGDRLFIVVEGQADVVVADDRGGRMILAKPGRGEVLGEMALLTGEPRNADVVASTPMRTLAIQAVDFQDLVARHPVVSVILTDLAARRLGSGEFDALRGKVLNGYRIARCLGRGGMAIVYEAEAVEGGQHVALKMMNHSLVYNAQIFQRFQREADIVESLRHQNIAAMYGRFAAYNTYFIVMEFCDGPTLSQIIEATAELPEDEVRRVVGQLSRALDHVHAMGIVHRDLKPSNVMVNRDGTVKLTDFGIAKPDAASDLTRSGMVLGTPRYMPPEQLAGKPVDRRADLYALGCLLYAMLTREPLFEGSDVAQVLYQKLTWRLPSRRAVRKGLKRDLYEILRRSLEVDPDKRTVDLKELSAWAGPVAAARLCPLRPERNFEIAPTETIGPAG